MHHASYRDLHTGFFVSLLAIVQTTKNGDYTTGKVFQNEKDWYFCLDFCLSKRNMHSELR